LSLGEEDTIGKTRGFSEFTSLKVTCN
jgi:hypothetical protein